MGLAKYFDKAALAASKILQGYNRAAFEARLMAAPVQIAFDKTAASSAEGLATLDLTVRLLARLYPKLKIMALDSYSKSLCEVLKRLAKTINSNIEFTEVLSFVTIVVGSTKVEDSSNYFYIGSNEWNVHLSRSEPVITGNSQNPFGAGAAACLGAANAFRVVFSDQLTHGEPDNAFSFSLLNFEQGTQTAQESLTDLEVLLQDVFLVGFGAIGNGVVWGLSKLKKLKGTLYVIDHEKIESSNLQRYVLTTEEDLNKEKIRLCDDLNQTGVFHPFPGKWADFLAVRKNWDLPFVALAVDSAEDRIAIQGSLPKYILNAWTQAEDLGISRHFDFINEACVCCLYPPRSGGQSKSELIAGALGLATREPEIRALVYNNSPLDEQWVRAIAEAKMISFEELHSFVGLPITEFYSKVLCGGLVMTDVKNQTTETPMAFQSAMAGILLASEIVIHATGIRKNKVAPITRINLLRPITAYLNEPLQKTTQEKCICHDEEFRKQYCLKYAL